MLRSKTKRLRQKKFAFAAESFDVTVAVAFLNVGSDSALRSLMSQSRYSEYSITTCEAAISGLTVIASSRTSFDQGFAKKNFFEAVVFDFSENR